MNTARAARAVSCIRATVLAVLLLASYGYFYEGGGWNQNTRFDLVRAIVENHTLRIDLYHENTGDKAHVGDHYYTDKAPGASLTAVPAVALVRALMRASGARVDTPQAVVALSYVATFAAAAVPAALAALCVFAIALRLGADDGAATVAALVCGLATPLWPYATLLYGHALAGGCLMLAFLGALLMAEPGSRGRQWALGLLTGFAAGWAVVTEYPASIPSGLIVAFALWELRARPDRAPIVRAAVALTVGLSAAAIVLLAYNQMAFGTPLHIGYASEEGYEAMRTGIFGVNLPDLTAARELLFGAYRGLLPLAPVLAITPAGYWLLLSNRPTRGVALVGGAVILYYFLMTAGYAYWSGGWSYGSRHLGPALAFMGVGIAPLWRRAHPVVRGGILLLALFSAAQSLVAVSTTPQPPADVERPMRELLWPAFREGDFAISWQSVLDLRPLPGAMSQLEHDGAPRAAWNLGQLLGLKGHASLLPLAATWILCGAAWVLAGSASTRDQKRKTPPLLGGI